MALCVCREAASWWMSPFPRGAVFFVRRLARDIMKARHIIPLLLLAGGITVGAQTTNTTPHTKAMSYTLVYEEPVKTVKNPTEADIRAALNTRVAGDIGPVFRIEADGTEETLQVVTMDKNIFSFNYLPNAKEQWASKKENFGHEETLKIVLAFWSNSPDWKKSVEWTHQKL